jgi:VWFA-related protein
MHHRLIFAALLTLGAQQLPVFRTGASFVRVDVYPSKDGRIVPGLTKSDFQLFEDGKPQTIETFEYIEFPTFASEAERRDPATREEGEAAAADPRNRVFVLFLDTFHVRVDAAHRSRLPLIAFLDRTIGPNDVFGVSSPRVPYSDLTFGRKVAGTEDMLTRHWVWGDADFKPDDEMARLFQECYSGRNEHLVGPLIMRERQDRVLRRLQDLVEYLGRLRQERKNLVLFSQGWALMGPAPELLASLQGNPMPRPPGPGPDGRLVLDERSRSFGSGATKCETERVRLATEDFRDRFRDLLTAARRANVSFFPVNPAGLSTDLDIIALEVDQKQRALGTPVDRLRELAINTDGISVVDTNDIRTHMMKITDSLSAYYLLGYYPTNSKMDGGVRQIQVKLEPSAGKGLDLKSRRQYRAPSAKEAAELARPVAAPASTVAPDVDAAIATLARLGGPRADVVGRVSAVAPGEIALVAETPRAFAADIDVQAIVTDASGAAAGTGRGRIAAGMRAVLVRLAVPPASRGPWQVVMRISGDEVRGGDTFEVRAAGVAVGDAVLIRTEPGQSSRPAAAPVFSRRERLRAEWTLAGDPASVSSRQARLLDRRGEPLPIDVTVADRDDRGRTIFAADATLAPLSPGDYMIELVVTSGGQTSRRLVAFRVTQ